MDYTHFIQDERYQIAILNKAGHAQSEIAQLIDRYLSTTSREVLLAVVSAADLKLSVHR
jgi:IS30 family transposase